MTQHPPVSSASGFFSSLFDFSFRTFVTPRIIRILYVLSLVLIGIWALVFLVAIFASFDDPFTPIGMSVIMLLLWPLGVLFAVIYARVLLEFVMVVFRIGESTEATARHLAGGGPAAGGPPSPGSAGSAPPPTWGGPGPSAAPGPTSPSAPSPGDQPPPPDAPQGPADRPWS